MVRKQLGRVGDYIPVNIRLNGSKYTQCIETKVSVDKVNVNESNGGSITKLGMFNGMVIFGHSKSVDNP